MNVLTWLLFVWAAAAAGLIVLQLVGGLWYDITDLHQRRLRLRSRYAKRYRTKPAITVLIPTLNNEATITDCLRSVLATRYPKLRIVIVDMASKDATRTKVRTLMRRHKKTIKLVSRRSQRDPLPALYKASSMTKDDWVMVLSPTSCLDPSMLTQTIQKSQQQGGDVIVPRQVVTHVQSLAGIYQKYLEFFVVRAAKYRAVTKLPLGTMLSGSLMRQDIWSDICKKQRHLSLEQLLSFDPQTLVNTRLTYASAAQLIVPAPTTLTEYFLAFALYQYRLIQRVGHALHLSTQSNRTLLQQFFAGLRGLAISVGGLCTGLAPIGLTYLLYLAAGLHEPLFIGIAAAVVLCVVISGIFGSDQLRLRQKAVYCLGSPLAFGAVIILVFSIVWVLLVQLGRGGRKLSQQFMQVLNHRTPSRIAA